MAEEKFLPYIDPQYLKQPSGFQTDHLPTVPEDTCLLEQGISSQDVSNPAMVLGLLKWLIDSMSEVKFRLEKIESGMNDVQQKLDEREEVSPTESKYETGDETGDETDVLLGDAAYYEYDEEVPDIEHYM